MSKFKRLQKSEIKIVRMAALGGALEFYDFMLFIFLANVISPQYFPAKQHINSLLATFCAFTIGYLVRPVGGLVFSHYGDLYGRKKALYLSIILMGFPSLLIAFLPNYNMIGVLAPVILVSLRIIQGMAIGGEIPGAITFTFEHVAVNKRGSAIVAIFFILSLATLFCQSVVAFLQMLLSREQFYNWGWRIPFFIGSVLSILGYYIRKNLLETPEFISFDAKLKRKQLPFIFLMRTHFIEFLQGFSVLCLGAVSMFLLFIYMPIYITTFKNHFIISNYEVHLFNAVNLGIFSIVMLIFGNLSDYISRKKLIVLGSFLLVIFTYPLFTVILNNSIFFMLVALILLGIFFAMIAGCYGAMLAELFPTQIRYTGIGLTYNIAFAVFGGTTMLIGTLLIKITHNPLSLAFYLIIFAAISLLGTLTINYEKLN